MAWGWRVQAVGALIAGGGLGLVALTGESARSAAAAAREIESAVAAGRAAPEALLPETIKRLQERLASPDLPLGSYHAGPLWLVRRRSDCKVP